MDKLRKLIMILGLVIVDDRVCQHIPVLFRRFPIVLQQRYNSKIIHHNWKQGRENFLFLQHLAPCPSIVKNQAELLMKHGLWLIPDHIHPDLAESLVTAKIQFNETIK
ncbi:hypothetical protein T12_907 [Trichinella patagoniensis]|nr:hypothetical protein T12_907 [Trichinella patagoniensis]